MHLSPDGLWRWDGTRWLPVAGPTSPPAPRNWLATAGATTAITAVSAITAGCFLPYVRYYTVEPGYSQTPSVFNGGFAGAWGNVAEPALVILFTLAAAVLIIAWPNRTVRTFASGAIVVMGAQTFMLFIGYVAGAAPVGQLQSGSFVGLFGAFLLCVGGAISAASLLVGPRPAP